MNIAQGGHPILALGLTALFFIVVFGAIWRLTRKAPERNSNPADRIRDLDRYSDPTNTGLP